MILLTKPELIEKLRISTTTLDTLQKKGLPRIAMNGKSLRYDFDEVVAWLKKTFRQGVIAEDINTKSE